MTISTEAAKKPQEAQAPEDPPTSSRDQLGLYVGENGAAGTVQQVDLAI